MNEALSSWDLNSFYAQARIEALKEPDPTLRTELLGCLISGGEYDVADLAVNAFQQQPNEADDEPGVLSYMKLLSGKILVGILAEHGLFEHAEFVVDTLERLGDPDVYCSIDKLLRHGYAGRDERYLHLDFMPEIELARVEGREPGGIVFRHLEALASYGLDLFDPTTFQGRLFERSIEASSMQDQRYRGIAYAYATGGHTYRAMCAKDKIHDPYQRAFACVYVAPEALAEESLTAADLLVREAEDLLESIRTCDGSCGRVNCDPILNAREIETQIALVLARKGLTTEAEKMVSNLEPELAYDQSLVHTEIYKRSGNPAARKKALTALAGMSVYYRPEFAGKVIEEIGLADQRWGNIVPSLAADGEFVPLIAWELHSQWGRKGRVERRAECGDINGPGSIVMKMFGSPEAYSAEMAKKRLQLRDHTLGVVAELLMRNHALSEALRLIMLIEDPAERVRAVLAAHSRQA